MSEISKNIDEENLGSYSSNSSSSSSGSSNRSSDLSSHGNSEESEGRRMSDWSDLASRLVDKLTGKNLQVTYAFDNLEIEIPKAYGPGGKQLGGATWKVDGKIIISIEHMDSSKTASSGV